MKVPHKSRNLYDLLCHLYANLCLVLIWISNQLKEVIFCCRALHTFSFQSLENSVEVLNMLLKGFSECQHIIQVHIANFISETN